jgi:exopolysaccharide biosynthesis polyprenyl glycosylphosphotransferase
MRAPRRLVFAGSREKAVLLADLLEAAEDHLFEMVEVIQIPHEDSFELLEVCLRDQAEQLVVEVGSGPTAFRQAVTCLARGVRVLDLGTFLETAFGQVLPESLDASWLSAMSAAQTPRLSRILKRLLDIFLAGLLLLLTLPFWPLLAAVVYFSSRGPVFFSQVRVGRGGRPFVLYKLRTMRVDAEAERGAVWASERDQRITRVGWWLRRLRLDELPQFWNVLKGEMSFVGPRPERPQFVELLTGKLPGYRLRHLVKPGITGWAQVNFPYGASVEDARSKLCYDLYYVKRGGFLLDLRIVLRTFGALAAGSR